MVRRCQKRVKLTFKYYCKKVSISQVDTLEISSRLALIVGCTFSSAQIDSSKTYFEMQLVEFPFMSHM